VAELTVTQQRDLIKEFITFIQVEKGLARLTLESYSRDLARLNSWAAKNGKPGFGTHSSRSAEVDRKSISRRSRPYFSRACSECGARLF
jgi:site-specific recombinase XerD